MTLLDLPLFIALFIWEEFVKQCEVTKNYGFLGSFIFTSVEDTKSMNDKIAIERARGWVSFSVTKFFKRQ